MQNKISTAVILAAGMGIRIKPIFDTKPKGFLVFGDKPIIEESIENLYSCGITSVIIVTGFMAEYYDNLKEQYPKIKNIKNEAFETSGSMYSLYCARDSVAEDFLLLESDLIYDPIALKELISHPKDDVILMSGLSNSNDEVFIEAENDKLVSMSKDKKAINTISGELVGISKISLTLYSKMLQFAQSRFANSYHVNYETDCLVAAAKEHPIFCHKIETLLWGEIDNYEHYMRAKDIIYPQIIKKKDSYS